MARLEESRTRALSLDSGLDPRPLAPSGLIPAPKP